MDFKKFNVFIRSDLYRYAGNSKFSSFLYHIILSPGFIYSFWMRTSAFLSSHLLSRICIFPLAWLILRHYEFKFGFAISFRTRIGPGFYLGHNGGIVVSDHVVIGRNCNLSHQVTLGVANRGERQGTPMIGDDVYIGPGAKVIGKIFVGDRAAIGANCVVTRDVPENGVVVGIPGKVISQNGSAGYIHNTDYDE